MSRLHFIRVTLVAIVVIAGDRGLAQQETGSDAHTYTVFLRSQAIGQENVSVTRHADGWSIRGNSRLGPPLDILMRNAEIHYDSEWRPSRLLLDSVTRAQEVTVKATFSNGQAATEIIIAGSPTTKSDPVAADTIVLPNAFFGSYATD